MTLMTRDAVRVAMFALGTSLWIGTATVGCSGDEEGCEVPRECRGCAADGQCCSTSDNCLAGSICNQATEDLYRPDQPSGVCVRVVCMTDADCEPGQKCGLTNVCSAPTCQVTSDCISGVCLGGTCQPAPPPTDAVSCVVLTPTAVLRPGSTAPLHALAKSANGEVLPMMAFDWTSDDSSVATVEEGVVTGGTAAGTTRVGARVRGHAVVQCLGAALVTNLPDVTAGALRVVVVSDESGAPVSDALVVMEARGTFTSTTGAGGTVEIPVPPGTDVGSVSVVKSGWKSVAVLDPETQDLFVTLSPEVDERTVGGVRGVLDLSSTRTAELKLGIAGPALPSNLLGLSLDSFIGDFFETAIRVSGINQDVSLPGSVVLGLESEQFSADGAGPRCQGIVPQATELGCFVARAPKGRTATWALGGQLRIATVLPVINQLAGALDADAGQIDVASLLTTILPLTQTLSHGVVSDVEISTNPVLATGDPDYSKFVRTDITVDHAQTVLSKVRVPDLPSLRGSTSGCARATILAAASVLPGRGLVPLGLSAGLDVVGNEASDCRIAGIDAPFGSRSDPLPDGTMPLTMAPPHGGLEGAPVVLIALALDPESLTVEGGAVQMSALVRRVQAVGSSETVPGPYLGLPTGTVEKRSSSVILDGVVGGSTLTRIEIVDSTGRTWVVFAPAAMTRIALPAIVVSSGALANLTSATILSLGVASGSYRDLFTAGSGHTLDRLIDDVSGFSLQLCQSPTTAHPSPPCRID